jgi:putative ABC transport system permease protein
MIATRLYQLAQLAFPKRHRDRYQREMLHAFESEFAAKRTAGLPAAIVFVTAACLNAIGAGLAERRRFRVVRFGHAFSALDFTLAWRVLLRYPGLSIVGVFGMAVGIAVATGAFALVSMLMDPRLPLPEGERIVSVLTMDASTMNVESKMIRDYQAWRGLASFEDLSIARTVSRNLLIEGRSSEPVTAFEISASAFRVARVAAFRGRHLLPEDEAPGAAGAMVIAYDEWVTRFAASPDIIGRPVRLGGEAYEIVGVMPEGFTFPTNHTIWIPWRLEPLAYQPRTGPIITVFGRLAPGATLQSAQAELAEAGRRAAADSPATHEHLRPRVMPYVYAYTGMGNPENFLAMRAIQFALVLLLVIVCVNVAILVYARTATRQGEIAVRAALGASRLRIVSQLFVEALTLAGVAAAIGVFLVLVMMPQLEAAFLSIVGGRMPFWMEFGLRSDGVLYVVGLTLLAAAIVGVLPALKATGQQVHGGLQALSPGSGSRMQMGRLWTLLIVTQVALTVALMPAAMFYTWDGLRLRTGDAGFASREFVSATLAMDRSSETPTASGDAAFASRYAAAHRTLDERLRAEAAAANVTFSLTDAGAELAMVVVAEDQPPPTDPADYNIVDGSKLGHLARYNRVAIDFFDAFDVPTLLGRDFTAADLGTGNVVVNRAFADAVFGSDNPLGRRVKYVGRSREAKAEDNVPQELERWHEIIGVIPDFPANHVSPERRIYHAAAFGDVYPARVAIRVRGNDPATFTGALRDASVTVNPNLQVRDVTTIDMLVEREQGTFRIIGITVGLVMLSVLTLSAAGIYALMSFTVARRKREIGIRAALGADRNRLLAGIFSRALAQLGAGAAVGLLGAVGLENALEGEMFQGYGAVILPLVALVMTTVGVLAAIGPARRGLQIQPTEALREE